MLWTFIALHCFDIYMRCMYCSPVTSTEPRPFGSNIFAIPMPNLSMSNPTECAVGGVDKECCGYEPLTEGNIYNSLDETPVVPSTATRPILSSKSTTRESRDENGYLKCRDSSAWFLMLLPSPCSKKYLPLCGILLFGFVVLLPRDAM